MKVLITGGAGFIGGKIANKLYDLGHNVKIYDILTKQVHGDKPEESFLVKKINKNIELVRADILDREKLNAAIQNIDVVIHLASETGTGQSMYEIEKYYSVNVLGTALLIDVIANSRNILKRVILSSSRAVYGEGQYHCDCCGDMYPDERVENKLKNGHYDFFCDNCGNQLKLVATSEESKLKPKSVYGLTKKMQEEMIFNAKNLLDVDICIFRYQNVYGAGQSLSNPYTGILSIFSKLILNEEKINIFEDGFESRDFIYVDDVVDATVLGAIHKDEINDIFNVGVGKNISVLDMTKRLYELYNKSEKYEISGKYRIGDIRHNYADISKIKAILGWEPKIPLEEGLVIFTNWVKSQNIHNFRSEYQNSLVELERRGLLK